MKKTILSFVTITGFVFYVALFGKSNIQTYTANTITTTDEKTKKPTTPDRLVDKAPSKPVTPATIPTPTPVPKPKGAYKDGTYVGFSADAYYGYIKVKAIIKDGELSDVIFLDHPQDRRTSISINNYAMPALKTEAIKAQNANVSTVSGATDSSIAFRESLASALAQAKN